MPSTVACAAAPPAALSDSRTRRSGLYIAEHHAEGADEKGRAGAAFSGGRRRTAAAEVLIGTHPAERCDRSWVGYPGAAATVLGDP